MYQELREAWGELTAPGQMFEIVETEVRGQRLRSFANAPGSLRELWLMSAGYGDADYLVYQDERWSYAQAHDEVARIANWLVANGVGPRRRVAIAMRNYPEYMLAYWAVVSIGAVVVGMNAWWVTEEMAYGLRDSEPALMICDQQRYERFAPLAGEFPELRVVLVRPRGELPAGAVDWAELKTAEPELPGAEVQGDDDACVFYTSGTTGRPKGARLTNLGCTNNVMAVAFANMVQSAALARFDSGSGQAEAQPGVQHASIVATPLFHVTANNCVAQAITAGGGKLIHMYRWDAGEALRLIEEEKVTGISAVPVMVRELLNHEDFASRDISSLESFGGGGAPVQPDLVEKIERQGGAATPAQGYGMTETCGIIAAHGGPYLVDKPASTGFVMPNFEVRCVDEAGAEVPAGERGEVCVRGIQVIKGYLNRPEATAETIVDGWLRTGDIGYLDEDNFLYLVDRVKDMVLRGGENVYCSEVETAVFQHDAVAEAAVFAVPDERLGEEVGVALVLRAEARLAADELREFLKQRLSAHKIPRYVWILDEPLPRNASGKFLKRELRESLDIEDAA